MAWLEVSLTVNGEAAEAVADLLTRFAPDGVALEAARFEQSPESERATPGDEVIVSAYLPVNAALEDTRAQLEQGLWHLGQLLPLPTPAYRPVAETDWSESWKVNFHPLRVGRRLMIVPAWLNPPLAPDDIAIRLDPGMAFGTGTHPTTQLLPGSHRAAPQARPAHGRPGHRLRHPGHRRRPAGRRPGAGAGCGPRGGARGRRERAGQWRRANGLARRGIVVAQGSLAEMLRRPTSAPEWRQAPLVVANILAHIIVQLLHAGLADTVAPGGLLVASGILDSQAYQVIAALREHGLEVAGQEHIEDWVAIIARKNTATP